MRELGMDEAAVSRRDLRELISRRDLRRQLGDVVRHGHRAGIGRLETERLEMRFPCRLRIVPRSGGVIEVDGAETGASARPLEEQRAVIREKCEAVELGAELDEVELAARF
jgi:hypothetical protein